jgi:hypothetical protein
MKNASFDLLSFDLVTFSPGNIVVGKIQTTKHEIYITLYAYTLKYTYLISKKNILTGFKTVYFGQTK